MKKIKEIWNKIKKWFKYWFFYRPLIKKLLESKGFSKKWGYNKSKRNHFIDVIYNSILLNERMMKLEKNGDIYSTIKKKYINDEENMVEEDIDPKNIEKKIALNMLNKNIQPISEIQDINIENKKKNEDQNIGG